ncbi:MAG: hypothetical protein HKN47_28030 [Pirellulaceae bacterium]|nr:hypothetical protein [Pirellulaceae bacterium]
MTIHHAPRDQPEIPSHKVVVGKDDLVLIRGAQRLVIRDVDVHSLQCETYCRKPANKRGHLNQLRRQPQFGYRTTTITHGRDRLQTIVSLPWRNGEADLLTSYRWRVAGKVAESIRREVDAGRSVQRATWQIDGDLLSWTDGRSVRLSQIKDLAFFGDDESIIVPEQDRSIRLSSDSPDQMILSEFVRRRSLENHIDSKQSRLGGRLFTIQANALATARHAFYETASKFPIKVFGPVIVAILLFFLIPIVIGKAGALNQADLLFVGFLLCLLAGTLMLTIAADTVSEFFTSQFGWRTIQVHHRGLVIAGQGRSLISSEEIQDFRLDREVVYRGDDFVHSRYTLRLAFGWVDGSLTWKSYVWYEPVLARGEITFLRDFLRVATNGKMRKETNRDVLLADSISVPTQVICF